MSTLVVVGYADLMKHIAPRLIALVAVALVAGLTGCVTSKAKQISQQTENLLQAAGFKVIPASTPDQQQMLKTLPDASGERAVIRAVRRNAFNGEPWATK